MTDWPDVTIGIITYDRYDEIRQTVEALAEFVRYSGQLRYVIADDSSPGGYVARLKRLRLFRDLDATFISTETNGNGGWGVNANHLLGAVDSEYLLMLEDDYVLTRPLDLDPLVALMEDRPRIGMVRLRGTAGTHLKYTQFEADIRQRCPDFRQGVGVTGKLNFLLINGGSPDLWIYSNGPHLKRRLFHAYHGLYPQGFKLGETEERMAHRVKDGMQEKPDAAPWIAILPDWIAMQWLHIGTSYQKTAADRGRQT
jgi:glycosyltransferase involved in cell wall biosynthesis